MTDTPTDPDELIRAQLEILLRGALRRLSHLVPDLIPLAGTAELAHRCAVGLTVTLTGPDRDLRLSAARSIVRGLFGTTRPPRGWWSTELGQAVYAAGGMPDEPVPYVVAAEVLGVTRTRVSELVHGKREKWNQGGKLVDGPLPFTVTPESLRLRWEDRRGASYA